MKKHMLIFMLLLTLSNAFPPSPILQDSMEEGTRLTLVLPDSLREIGEGAFEGTAANKVILPQNLLKIGERAFADNFFLREIVIHETVHDIKDCAFEGSVNLTIIGTVDSYVAQWAKEHDVCFIQMKSPAAWIKVLRKLCAKSVYITFAFCPVCSGMIQQYRKRAAELGKSMRPQDRPELYPIDYRFP